MYKRKAEPKEKIEAVGLLDEADEYPYPTNQMRHPRQVPGVFAAEWGAGITLCNCGGNVPNPLCERTVNPCGCALLRSA